MPDQQRKLAAIVFTDIVGFTKLTADDQQKAIDLLDIQRKEFKPLVDSHGGKWVKEMGDGLILTFDTITNAVQCCLKFQEKAKSIEHLSLRIGIHLGEIMEKEGDIIGDDVNVAARIEPFSAPGGIAISNKVNDALVREKEFTTKYLGKPQLKGVGQEVKVYCITSHDLPETDLSQVSAKLEPEGFQWNVKNSIGVAASVIGLLFLLNFFFLRIGYADKDETPSIAILPFENKGPETDEFYAYGISSDLIADVTSAGLIRVASLSDVEKLDYKNIKNSELAKDLFVRYVAKGTLWKMDSVFQLSMEIFDTKENKVVYTKRWQTDWKDLATIKDDLSDNILETLEIKILQDPENQIVESNPEAYEYYLRAKHKYAKRENTDDIELVRGLLNKAIEIDENLILAITALAKTYTDVGEYDKAMELNNAALKQSEEIGDKGGIGQSLIHIGNVYFYKNEIEMSLDYFYKTLAIFEEIGDKAGMGTILNNIGVINSYKGDLDQALNYHERSLAIKDELGDKGGIGNSLGNIGLVYEKKGDLNDALNYYERSLAIRDELGDKRGIGTVFANLGSLHWKKGDLNSALDYLNQGLKIDTELGDKRGMSLSLSNIGIGHWYKGELNKALDYYERSLAIQEEIDDKNGMAENYNNIGNVYLNKGNYEIAIKYLEKSLNIKNGQLTATTLLSLAQKHLGKEYDLQEIHKLIEEPDEIDYGINFSLYELLEDKSYLETAHTQLQKKADKMDHEMKDKFLNYPVQKQIIEAWEKVNA